MLELIFEYRALVAKRDRLHRALTSEELRRVVELEAELPAHIPGVVDRDPRVRLESPLPANFVFGGRHGAGVVRAVSRTGLAMVTSEPPELGCRLLVHVQDTVRCIEYTLPGRVVARVVRGVTSAVVAFDGVPSQSRLGGRPSGVWSQDVEASNRRSTIPGPRPSIPVPVKKTR